MEKLIHTLRLQVPAGKAVANQGINTALGQYGININTFLEQCNNETKMIPNDLLVNILVYLYENRTFKIQIKGLVLTKIISDYLIETNQSFLKKEDLVFILFFYSKYSVEDFNIKYLITNKTYFCAKLNILYGIVKSMHLTVI